MDRIEDNDEKYKNWEIRRLRRIISILILACITLTIISLALYLSADRDKIIITDLGLEYSPGLWHKNEENIFVYLSQHDNLIPYTIGFFDDDSEQLIDLSWIFFVEDELAAKKLKEPLTQSERDSLYNKLFNN